MARRKAQPNWSGKNAARSAAAGRLRQWLRVVRERVEVRDDISPDLRPGKPRESHLGALHGRLRMRQELVQVFDRPGAAHALHAIRIVEARHAGARTSDDAPEVGSD